MKAVSPLGASRGLITRLPGKLALVVQALVVLLPWCLRRPVLVALWGYRLHPTSHVGLAWIFPEHLEMEAGARIGHFTVCKGLAYLHLGQSGIIGRLNWISGYPRSGPAYRLDAGRRPELIVERHAAITNRHMIDCTNSVRIGAYSTVAGFWSQFLTHSIDLAQCRQASRPIIIGEYCFVGTNCVVLGGAALPDGSVLGAKSLLREAFTEPRTLYAGTPARPIRRIPADQAYFSRAEGFVL